MTINLSTSEILKNVQPTPTTDHSRSDEEKIGIIAKHFEGILKTLGLNLENESLKQSPHRIAKMYVNELFRGLNDKNFPKVAAIENEFDYEQMIVAKKVNIKSMCEHHFQTIDGVATIAYIPQHRLIGLSKLNRIADFFARRPQVQERLTKQIGDCLVYVLETPHVAVHIDARHFCLVSRGVEDSASTTITCDLRGDFKMKPEIRQEFMAYCDQLGR